MFFDEVVANCGKTTDVIPVIVDPVQVQPAVRTVPVEVRDIPVAVGVLPDG
jgi:hypothetical protein